MKLTAVVLTKNEEKNVEFCLRSLKWCDEILVIDDYSSDNTIAKAKKHGAIIYEHSLQGDFAAQRNFGLEKAKGDWVLFVDADERISDALASEIGERVNLRPSSGRTEGEGESINGFYIRRVDTMWGKELKHGETGNIKLIRLAKKDSGKWSGNVHEVWNIQGKIGQLKNPILHYPHQSLTEFLQEINFYTTLRARELYDKKIRVAWWEIIAYPKAKFFQNYIFKLGFLDGTAGIVFALCMSFHSFLVRGKLWSLWQEK